MTTRPLALYLLGSPRLEHDGQPLQMDTRKAIALLAYLALNDHPFGRDTLAALLWPDLDQSHARGALRRTLVPLNKALGAEALIATRESIGLHADFSLWVDARAFEQLIASTLLHGHPEGEACERCAEPLDAAARLYQGDFMAGFTLRDAPEFDDWQFFEAERLRRALATALARLAALHADAREFDAAVEPARRWLALDPLHEPAHRALMRLYAQTGQRAAALRQYRECVRVLDEELGVPPLEETTELYERILNERSTADRRPPTTDSGRQPVPSEAEGSAVGGQPTQLPLIGREAEWQALLAAFDAVRTVGRLVVIEGEAGIGKTRLAEAFLEHARERGALVLAARCFEGETDFAYGPLVTALGPLVDFAHDADLPQSVRSEAGRLFPELATETSAPLESPGAQSRFFESIRQLLRLGCGDAAPGVLFLDDLNWADSATLDMLTYFIRRLHDLPLLFIVSWRTESVPAEHRLRQLVSETRRGRSALELQLARLSDDAVRALVQAALGDAPPPAEVAARLHAEAEGVPFFVVEYLRLAQADAGAFRPSDWDMPSTVRGLLQSRLSQLGDAERQLLSTAAVIGRSFGFDTLRASSGRSAEETVGGLERLLAHGLIAELRGAGEPADLAYDFSHEQVRKLAYEQTSLARRRLLHGRVAEALAQRTRGAADASQIARHFRLAAQEPRAAEYYLRAGDQARAVYANTEALEHYQAALALGHADVSRLHEALGDVQTLRADYPEALHHYEAAAARCDPDTADLARIEHKLGTVYLRSGTWDLAESHFQSALRMYERLERTPEQARLRVDWSQAAHRRGDAARAQELARAALALAAQSGDPYGLAQAHNMLGILANHGGDFVSAREHLQNSLALAEKLEVAAARVAALNNLALVCGAGGDTEQALGLAEEALRLCQSIGDRHREAALRNNIADLLHKLGRRDEAMARLKEAVAMFAEVGVEEGSLQPEIWKLVEW